MKMKSIVFVAILALACFGIVHNRIATPSHNAARISEELRSTDWTNANRDAVKKFAESAKGRFACEAALCEAEIHETNGLLRFLRLAPPMDFRALVHTSGNTIRDYSITLTNESHRSSSIWFVKAFDRVAFDMQNETFRVQTGNGRDPFLMVTVTPSASNEQQMLIQKIDLQCLSRIGGCIGQQLGPEIWRLANRAGEQGRVAQPLILFDANESIPSLPH